MAITATIALLPQSITLPGNTNDQEYNFNIPMKSQDGLEQIQLMVEVISGTLKCAVGASAAGSAANFTVAAKFPIIVGSRPDSVNTLHLKGAAGGEVVNLYHIG